MPGSMLVVWLMWVCPWAPGTVMRPVHQSCFRYWCLLCPCSLLVVWLMWVCPWAPGTVMRPVHQSCFRYWCLLCPCSLRRSGRCHNFLGVLFSRLAVRFRHDCGPGRGQLHQMLMRRHQHPNQNPLTQMMQMSGTGSGGMRFP